VWITAAAATFILLLRPQLNPLILFAASGALFAIAAVFTG
jgi:hypothetical protein